MHDFFCRMLLAHMNKPEQGIEQRAGPPPVWMLIVLALCLWGGEYIRRDLWEPDEARFALVAREMRDGNHWLVPFRQGEFYAHKPPLMFWLINAGSALTGGHIGGLATRVPSFLGALMALWAASRLAAAWFTPRAAWLTVLLLPSSFLFWNKGGFGQIDMLLCGLQMMALYGLFVGQTDGRKGWVVLACVLMGLGVLAKGPVGLLVPLGVYVAARYASGEPARVPGHWTWGPLLALSLPAIWLGLAWWSGAPDGYFHELIFSQNIGRVAGEFGGHRRPFYYFLYHFPLDFLPWTLLLPLSYKVLRRAPEADRGRRMLVAWILFVILFFSISASKRNLYILLAYPAAAILVAAAADHWQQASSRCLRYTFWSVFGLMTLIGVVMLAGSFMTTLPIRSVMLLPGGLVMLAGAWWAAETWRQTPRHPAWLGAAAATMLFTFASVGALVMPEIDHHKAPHVLVGPARALLAPGDRIIMYKQHGEIFSLYTERTGYMAFRDRDMVDFILEAPQTNHLIVARERDVAAVQRVLGPGYHPVRFEMGNKELAWFAVADAGSLRASLRQRREAGGFMAMDREPEPPPANE